MLSGNFGVQLLEKIVRHVALTQIVAVDDSCTAVPAKYRFVVARGPHRLGFFKTIHRLTKKFVCRDAAFCKLAFARRSYMMPV